MGFIALRRLREIYGRGCLAPLFGHTERDQTFLFFMHARDIVVCVLTKNMKLKRQRMYLAHVAPQSATILDEFRAFLEK